MSEKLIEVPWPGRNSHLALLHNRALTLIKCLLKPLKPVLKALLGKQKVQWCPQDAISEVESILFFFEAKVKQ